MVDDLVAQFLKMKECDHICASCIYNKDSYPLVHSYCEKGERTEGEHITECSSFKRAWK